jgi:hypothetical protein
VIIRDLRASMKDWPAVLVASRQIYSFPRKNSLFGLIDGERISIWRMDNIGIFRHEETCREATAISCDFVHRNEVEYRMISMRLTAFMNSWMDALRRIPGG